MILTFPNAGPFNIGPCAVLTPDPKIIFVAASSL